MDCHCHLRESSQPRDWTCVGRQMLYCGATNQIIFLLCFCVFSVKLPSPASVGWVSPTTFRLTLPDLNWCMLRGGFPCGSAGAQRISRKFPCATVYSSNKMKPGFLRLTNGWISRHYSMGALWNVALETLGHECEEQQWSVVSDLRGNRESPCPQRYERLEGVTKIKLLWTKSI